MYYFAYAINMEKRRMLQDCPDAKPLFTATLPNYKLIFSGWSREWHGGKATILSSRGDRVKGAVYEISEACLRRLDKIEAGYMRLNINVFNEDGVAFQAVTHLKTGQLEITSPSKEYAEILRRGYLDWGLI